MMFWSKNMRFWMQGFLFIAAFLLSVPALADKTSETLGAWNTDYEAATQQAKQLDRLILANFEGSDWCPPCKAMDKQVFSKEEFLRHAKDNLILLKLDFPRRIKQSEELQKQNQELAEKYRVEAFPTVLMLDGEGKEVHRMEGYGGDSASEFVEKLKQISDKK